MRLPKASRLKKTPVSSKICNYGNHGTVTFHVLVLFITCTVSKDFGRKINAVAEFLKSSSFFISFQKNHWNKIIYLLLLNKHFFRSLLATRAREHFELCAHMLSSHVYLVNVSLSDVALGAYALNKYIIMNPRCPLDLRLKPRKYKVWDDITFTKLQPIGCRYICLKKTSSGK